MVTIVSELSRNILKYAERGVCEFELFDGPRETRIRCVFKDNGPGIDDTKAALTDGYSTSATLGVGLPGAKRLADRFDILTSADGTAVEIEVHTRSLHPSRNQIAQVRESLPIAEPPRFGVAIRPFKHGRFSGDQAGVWFDESRITACIIDGLGHGEAAETAALEALKFIEHNRGQAILDLIRGCDEQLRGTRGAAIGIAMIDRQTGNLEYAGVGNPRCAIVSNQVVYLGSVYGIVGEGGFVPALERCQLVRRDTIMLWTDGLPEAIRMVPTRVRRMADAQAFSNDLIKQHAIDDDDAGVVIVRWDG